MFILHGAIYFLLLVSIFSQKGCKTLLYALIQWDLPFFSGLTVIEGLIFQLCEVESGHPHFVMPHCLDLLSLRFDV